MSLTTVQLRATTVGEAGAAVAAVRRGISPGKLVGIQVNYHADAPAGTVIELKNVLAGVESTLLSTSPAGGNTDVPLQAFTNKPINSTGAQVNVHVPPQVSGVLLLEVAGCDALTDAVVVTCLIEA